MISDLNHQLQYISVSHLLSFLVITESQETQGDADVKLKDSVLRNSKMVHYVTSKESTSMKQKYRVY